MSQLIERREPGFWKRGPDTLKRRRREAAEEAAAEAAFDAVVDSLIEEILSLTANAPDALLLARITCQVCGSSLEIKPPHCHCGEQAEAEELDDLL